MLFGESIHTGPCRKVVGILRAAVQHDEQGAPAGAMTTRNIELVVSAPGRAGKGPAQILSAIRDFERLAGPSTRQRIKTEPWEFGVAEHR